MTIQEFLITSFAPYAGIIFLLVFLAANTSLNHHIRKLFFLLSVVLFAELTFFNLQLWTSYFSKPGMARVLFSVLGYSLRIIAVYLFLLISIRNYATAKSRILWAIPAIFNEIVVFSAFFSKIAFSFSADNHFIRGPLGYTPHIIFLFYLAALLLLTIRQLRGLHRLEVVTLFLIVLFIATSVIVETVFAIEGLSCSASVLCMIFYYMFFQTQVYRATMAEEQKIRELFEKKSKTDDITGLLNKTAFWEEAQSAIHDNPQGSGTLVFLDLDHFKSINDHLGHLIGDKVIQDTARKLRAIFRNADILGLFGGDEFCAFLQNIPEETLRERLDEALCALRTEYSNETSHIQITASIGAAYCSELSNINLRLLVDLADCAAYEAKSNGRNRYIIKRYKA